jgi:cob(I)alamin adenosyltransferase
LDFRINRVYTRTGDEGETGLVGGRRVAKTSVRVEAFGEIDELNSVLGCAKELVGPSTAALREVIENLQQELFDLGSELATHPADSYPGMWHADALHVERLEKLCDCFGEGLPELRSFILPGGSPLAAELHLARTISRRAERAILRISQSENAANPVSAVPAVSDAVKQYINRVSDLLFMLARWSLKQEGREVPVWVVEKDRSKVGN